MRVSDQRFTDDDIRRARFTCEDPLSQERVVSAIPEGVELLRLENRYDLPKSVPKIRCAACGMSLHRKGFTGLLTNGDRILLGSHCGAETFGSWENAAREFEELRDRQYYLKRIDLLRTYAPDILFELQHWAATAEQFEAVIGRVRDAMPELFDSLRRAARARGQLTREERVQRRVLGQTGLRRSSFIEVVSDGPVPARAALADISPLGVIRRAMSVVGQALPSGADDSAETRSSALAADFRLAESILSQLSDVHRALLALPELFDASNLARVMRWAQRSGLRGHFEHVGNAFVAPNGDQITLPPNYSAPSNRLGDLLIEFWGVGRRKIA